MEKTNAHITEYRENKDIDFQGITSFKVLNHGESTVDINTIPVYPGQTTTIVEEDGTYCDFNMKAVFTEAGKLPKFKAIYKQLDAESGQNDNTTPPIYAATLYKYEQGDIVEFSQNRSGLTVLTRSFDGGVNFYPFNDIYLGYVEANQIVKYDRGGSLETNAIQFRNNDLAENSEIFRVGEQPVFDVELVEIIPYDDSQNTLVLVRIPVYSSGDVRIISSDSDGNERETVTGLHGIYEDTFYFSLNTDVYGTLTSLKFQNLQTMAFSNELITT